MSAKTVSAHAMVVVTPDNGVSLQRRVTSTGSSDNTDAAGPAAPYWVKLTRTGGLFTAQHSADGVTWVDLADTAPVEISMPSSVYIGLAVTRHNRNEMTRAVFSNFSIAGSVSGAWQVEALGVDPPSNDPTPLYVAVEDSSGNLKTIVHPDSEATLMTQWQTWQVPFSALSGVNLNAVKMLYLGVGAQENPSAGGTGQVFIDDIWVGHPASAEPAIE